jgi:hypothetical protein
MARQLLAMAIETDVGHLLGDISVPTLVLHRRDDSLVPIELGRELSEKIPQATFVELSGTDHLSFAGDVDEYIDEVEESSLENVSSASPIGSSPQSSSPTSSTRPDARPSSAIAVGGNSSGPPMKSSDARSPRYQGEEVKTAGDGFLAKFELPAGAIRCAQVIRAHSPRWASGCGPAFTPGSASSSATTWDGLPFTSPLGSLLSARRTKCSFPGP